MKLIDLLVHVLPKRGGWPDGAYVCFVNHRENEMAYFHAVNGRFVESEPVNTSGVDLKNGETQYVTREQYEAALAAAQQAVWNGEGLPPVGCECEYSLNAGDTWHNCKIDYVLGTQGLIMLADVFEGAQYVPFRQYAGKLQFRPIRSEADKKRDAAIEAMWKLENIGDYDDAGVIYDAIAAGKVPGIRLE